LLDKKRILQSQAATDPRRSAKFKALEEGFQQFATDLNKLQQFVEINGTAFAKILKKWDKTSKSRTKELYLARAVEVQPFFNAPVISELSDQATTSLQELGAWSDGDTSALGSSSYSGTSNGGSLHPFNNASLVSADNSDGDAESLLYDAVMLGDGDALKSLIESMRECDMKAAEASSTISVTAAAVAFTNRLNRVFLASIKEASPEALNILLNCKHLNVQTQDDINERNCLHQAAIHGKMAVLQQGLLRGVSPERRDVYGRIPLHYACIHGRLEIVRALLLGMFIFVCG